MFTTFRKAKGKYPGLQKGSRVKITCKDDSFEAEVVKVEYFQTIYSIPTELMFLDTGLTDFHEILELFDSIYGKDSFADRFVLIVLKKDENIL